MKILTIIPARGGSKRIEKKNIKPFLGMPMMAWPIKSLKDSNIEMDIVVSSDDKEILQIAEELGVEAVKRDEKLSDDYTTSMEVVNDYVESIGNIYDLIIKIYPTTPYLDISALKKGIELITAEKNAFSLASIKEFPHPISRKLINENKFARFKDKKYAKQRTQDCEKYYYDAANFYIFKKRFFEESMDIFDGSTIGVEVDKMLCVDIDNTEDWKLAERLIKFSV
ncbi:MAG: acylneuraminate cytidylyltransferase family protein [SAR86 cluster bacterium]|nr:acylneuraminate cytidylyltransferase family protein [SAR86 cluster bacterium]